MVRRCITIRAKKALLKLFNTWWRLRNINWYSIQEMPTLSFPTITPWRVLDELKLELKQLKVKVHEKWRPYYVKPNATELAGFTETYHDNVKFVTVRGAGHMVPSTKRREGFYLFNQTIYGKDLWRFIKISSLFITIQNKLKWILLMEAEESGWKDFFIDLTCGAMAGVTMILSAQPFEYVFV